MKVAVPSVILKFGRAVIDSAGFTVIEIVLVSDMPRLSVAVTDSYLVPAETDEAIVTTPVFVFIEIPALLLEIL